MGMAVEDTYKTPMARSPGGVVPAGLATPVLPI
jgi:hypothetical protein